MLPVTKPGRGSSPGTLPPAIEASAIRLRQRRTRGSRRISPGGAFDRPFVAHLGANSRSRGRHRTKVGEGSRGFAAFPAAAMPSLTPFD